LTPRPNERRAISSLDEIDWSFASATTLSTSAHSLHWFPGNFIPQIPSFLIQALSSPSAMVADPFCGSGTVGVEAALLGRNSWQGDSNHVSAMITRAKITLLTDPKLRTDIPALCDSLEWRFLQQSDAIGVNSEGSHSELNSWFHPDTLAQLRSIWKRIESEPNPGTREVLQMLFSDTLFSCASAGRPNTSGGKKRRHHWGWIADNVRPKLLVWHDARRLFFNLLQRTAEVLLATPLVKNVQLAFMSADSRALPLEASTVDLIVTSPPYLGMIDYATANRLTYLWFGWSLDADRLQEIGARSHRKRTSAISDYMRAIRTSAGEIHRVLKPDGACAIVIGASRKFPNANDLVISAFGESMSLFWGPRGRVPSRRRVSERQGTAPTEYICIFRKEP
jgi:DNA methylase